MLQATVNGEKDSGKVRDSNFELLRIICMIMIVQFHLGGYLYSYQPSPDDPTLNFIINRWLTVFGQSANICFVMITGYFMINGRLKFHKIIHLMFEVWFYSLLIGAIMIAAGLYETDYFVDLTLLFPLSYRTYWFVTDYILLLLLSPLINKVMNSSSKKTNAYLIIVLGILLYGFAAVFQIEFGKSLAAFILAYMVAAFIRKYPCRLTEKRRPAAICAVACLAYWFVFIAVVYSFFWNTELKDAETDPGLLIFMIAAAVVLILLAVSRIRHKTAVVASAAIILILASEIVYAQYKGADSVVTFSSLTTSIMPMLLGVSIFLFFKNTDIGKNRAINWVAKGALGVYLILCHPALYDYIWEQILPDYLISEWYYILVLLVLPPALALLAMVIDRIRDIAIFSPIERTAAVDGFYRKVDAKIDDILGVSSAPNADETGKS
jgi:hypothetical protein